MEENASEIIARAEAERSKIEKKETEARAKDEADIKENADKMRKARDENMKAEAETAERSRAWAEAKYRNRA